jgi:hypothetical protein
LDLKPSLNDNEINQQTRMKNHTLWVLGLMCVSMVEWKFTGSDVYFLEEWKSKATHVKVFQK